MQGEILASSTRLPFRLRYRREAERTIKQELMRPELDSQDFISFNYWDGGRKGLFSGEAFYLDLKRLELAYPDNNKREQELTRHVSLRQLDPMALLTLKATGRCQVTIPEWLYDRDCPGHYMRRIKSVALTIPSVVGPYTSLNCTLTPVEQQYPQIAFLVGGAYPRQGAGRQADLWTMPEARNQLSQVRAKMTAECLRRTCAMKDSCRLKALAR